MDLLKPTQRFLQQHASSILTGLSIAGVGATAVLTGQATVKASQILSQHMRDYQDEHDEPDISTDQSLILKAKLVWPYFVPAALAASATVVSIVMINRVSAREAAAMAAAYKMSEGRLKEYRAKVEQKLGVEKSADISNELAEQRMANADSTVNLASDEVLFLDALSGRYFMCSLVAIHKAENTVNHEIMTHGFASLGMFYDEIDLPPTDITEDLGWNSDRLVEVEISNGRSTDNRPCFILSFLTPPNPNYGRNTL